MILIFLTCSYVFSLFIYMKTDPTCERQKDKKQSRSMAATSKFAGMRKFMLAFSAAGRFIDLLCIFGLVANSQKPELLYH